jgi:hypothetical protein
MLHSTMEETGLAALTNLLWSHRKRGEGHSESFLYPTLLCLKEMLTFLVELIYLSNCFKGLKPFIQNHKMNHF